MNGGAGRRVYGFSSTDETRNGAAVEPLRELARLGLGELDRVGLAQLPSWAKSRPCATRLPVDAR